MYTQFYIHSALGSTPITERGSNYCDLLSYFTIDCESIEEAKQIAKDLLSVKYAKQVSYEIPEHVNQNLNHGTIYK